jgi:hypothetical protein
MMEIHHSKNKNRNLKKMMEGIGHQHLTHLNMDRRSKIIMHKVEILNKYYKFNNNRKNNYSEHKQSHQ